MNNQQQAQLEWRDGKIPISTQFDDPYFSLENGLAETEHVFLEGNTLPDRIDGSFAIGELGFGTGLNFLTLWKAMRDSQKQGPVTFTTFEAFPMGVEAMGKALSAFPEVSDLAQLLIASLEQGGTRHDFGIIRLEIVIGDVRETLSNHALSADAWFLDGFAPAKNPEMWGSDLMAEVGRHTKSGGTAATYTAAGHVRRSLEEAGFEVTRTSGYGRKRHMTRARKL